MRTFVHPIGNIFIQSGPHSWKFSTPRPLYLLYFARSLDHLFKKLPDETHEGSKQPCPVFCGVNFLHREPSFLHSSKFLAKKLACFYSVSFNFLANLALSTYNFSLQLTAQYTSDSIYCTQESFYFVFPTSEEYPWRDPSTVEYICVCPYEMTAGSYDTKAYSRKRCTQV